MPDETENREDPLPLRSVPLLRFSAGYLVRWGLYAAFIGGVVGALSFAFEWVLLALQDQTRDLWLYGLPVLGGLIMSAVMQYEPRTVRDGMQAYIDGVFTPGRPMRFLLLPLKFVASLLTLGTGGSGGRFGPVVLMGGVVGSQSARLSGKHAELDRPNAAMCGAAAAIGALLGTPLGGGIFAAEVLFPSSIRYHGLFAAILSSTMGYLVRRELRVVVEPMRTVHYSLSSWDIIPVVVTVVLAGLVGMAFVRIYRSSERLSARLQKRTGLTPAIGAWFVVALGWLSCVLGAKSGTEIMGTGERLLDQTINGSLPLMVAVAVLVFKALTTSATVGSGGSGGLFFPSLLLGAMVGNVVSQLAGSAATATTAATGLHYGLVAAGMAASLAAIVNVPVAAAVMMIEMFGSSYSVPIILGGVLGFAVGRPQVIYRYARLPIRPADE